MQIQPDDLDWLSGPQAAETLRSLAACDTSSLEIANVLRAEYSPDRSHLILQQVELRRRAAKKFARAEAMFFTPQGLEQATDDVVASYKAERFGAGGRVADLCCGIGGDLMNLAARAEATGVDIDPVCTRFAELNCRAAGWTASVACRDAEGFPLSGFATWHIDPDRRPAGRRTSQVLLSSPGMEAIDALREQCPSAAVKLAPAAVAPAHWNSNAQREWISRDGEVKQQVAWFGELACQAGRRSATVLRGSLRRTVHENADKVDPPTAIGRYIFDPDAAILAARIVPALADELGLQIVDPASGYLTGDAPLEDLALTAFEVVEIMPLDRKRLRAWFRQRGIGRLEIKKRGVEIDPQRLRMELDLSGDEQATLIATRFQRKTVAVVCRRIEERTS